jgi:C-terminal processing protease CtpA/Prc
MQKLNKQLQQEFKQEGDRFLVVGTQTKGGAHPTYSFPLSSRAGEINKDLILWLPCAASTKKDWEGVGVTPDIKIKPNEDALKVAGTYLSNISTKLEHQNEIQYNQSNKTNR